MTNFDNLATYCILYSTTFTRRDSLPETHRSTECSEHALQGRNLPAVIGNLLLEPGQIPAHAIHAALRAELPNRDQLPERTAHVIRFAAEGPWFDEVCGLRPLDPEQRETFVDSLLAVTRPLVPG